MAPEKLTRQAVIERALRLADTEGLPAVTIRRLAAELGVAPTALYWHVKNKDELLSALADRLLAALVADVDPDRPWNQRLRAMVTTLVEQTRAHPYLSTLLPMIDKSVAEEYRRATDTAIGLLTEAGFTLQEADQVATYLLLGAVAMVSCQPGGVGSDEEEAAEFRRHHRLDLERLPPGRYPNLAAFAATLSAPPDLVAYYSFGIDLLLSAVETTAPNGRGVRR
ncbi:TetR/AcrR family transcriptional regulator [Streptosporangium roseum]|uniref:Transcriptional regulator, TetR family n=1 Tax=Streptosporangium roseum (strain ATCC 12428 / DSM 43021 / JCM 3005 / KCTC 9067 / NCIMB 10171 / NRRL 2505 / NI 9100) TaxID=479432 RepID=D2B3B8_STRRD|nr:TetR family transcriptional regulator [Streptosporangium roseum]ACZ87434.1 putative transcriptional regulator, TetR family [Streptosporangium roseum DSM 43021]